jgi:elongation factor P
MITPNEFKVGTIFRYKEGIFEVLSYHRQRTAQRRARVVAKIRNIDTGALIEESFESELKLEPVEVERRRSQYMYSDDLGFHFMDLGTYDQFALSREAIGDKALYLVENVETDVLHVEARPVTIEPAMFLEMVVAETEPDFKGDTAAGGGKPAILTTGLRITVPFFVKVGDRVKVDTRTNTYVERVQQRE